MSERDGAAEGANRDGSAEDDDRADRLANTPGKGITPEAADVEPAGPEEFGLVQAWWGGGKGKTTAALGLGMRAVGHGYRVHLLQFMKGGTASVEAVRGEYNAIAALPGFSYETTGHFGWHGFLDGSDDDEHAARAEAALARTRELVDAAGAADLDAPLPLEGDPEDGVHLLLLDEALYAANRDLIDPDDLVDLVENKPDRLELVLTGGHESPDYLLDSADLVTEVRKVKHPFDEGQRARKGAEY
ncbi:cob(I)yrinic acid a,c-diamide adenosyltransferase [Halorarum salinum]|uniref:Cob(I)yrinic acid a,c-diamide adenosyltransferase n=1 Tax=Halorarum salinum TaxID=2743089 RepID=A0A7D5LE53_9EURY|nr:cob(I)yrinic acid a,c-diamide adenosyltransferase [Halobaculum salinum]QLG64247.1 cob(I)yrinic acid a,c-diamide adenosyltransferase [Halobaculum salinum]